MTDISHIVVIGCSFSYGDGLDNPKEDSWAGILSKKLNVPIVNLSSRGGGNDRIMRRLYEYYYLNSSKNNNPFYVIAYSHSSRREEFIKETDNYTVISMKDDPALMKEQPFSYDCITNYDPLVSARKKLMLQSYVLDFLKFNNLNYLVTDFMPDTEDELNTISLLYPLVHERVYHDKFKIRDLCEFSVDYPKLPCGHDGIEANLEIGNYVYEQLVSLYNPKVNPQEYITIKQYIDHYGIAGSIGGDTAWH